MNFSNRLFAFDIKLISEINNFKFILDAFSFIRDLIIHKSVNNFKIICNITMDYFFGIIVLIKNFDK